MDLVSFALDAQASYSPDKPLFIDAENPSISLSADQTRCLVMELIAGLQAAGLQKGDPVMVCIPNNVRLLYLWATTYH
jgi:non-ribosomal peptide synthetase component E (peptide arylation enzyme)